MKVGDTLIPLGENSQTCKILIIQKPPKKMES